MRYPNFIEERKLWKQGYKFVVGIDEAGRGPLAGPVVAAAVCFDLKFNAPSFGFKLKDSKKLNEKQREFLYRKLTSHKKIKWATAVVSHKLIDRLNIFNATKLAMRKAVKGVVNKSSQPCFLLVDGNFALNNLNIAQKSIIGADEKVFSCVAAGIIAKVVRDRIMKKIHKKYPQYGFDFHKGYGTKLHIKNLKNFGISNIHRKSFEPIKTLVKK